MTPLTQEQSHAAAAAGEVPIELEDPRTGTTYVLIRADVFDRLRELLEASGEEVDARAWERLTRKARDQWAQENAY